MVLPSIYAKLKFTDERAQMCQLAHGVCGFQHKNVGVNHVFVTLSVQDEVMQSDETVFQHCLLQGYWDVKSIHSNYGQDKYFLFSTVFFTAFTGTDKMCFRHIEHSLTL